MSRDLRKYSNQTFRRLITGGIMLLVGVGGALIFYFYGEGAAILGIVCILAGLIPIGLILIILSIMEWIVEQNREK